ncbi:hypothetical protein LCGC14_0043780 [marine sediment metagenome]|uniref:PELOTA RNA binding domain-containing protein n=2 Tax=root TaxID=1 RepID=A0A7V1FP54_9RHOB|nr:cysteine protease StiP domain-containing protein [Sulfitobacter litoralis]HDZ53433.1 hypothetical protein [Sulfitobacter litoralis]
MLDTTSSARLTSGSYDASDVTFLLKTVALAPTAVDKKEALIQSGAAHYSEMISDERRPDARYLEIFEDARARGEGRIAKEMIGLALQIKKRIAAGELDAKITLCSLVRAGVPYGVLLHRELKAIGVDSVHYGVSIIRDRGLDEAAMAYISARHPEAGVVFVDGWTGKGAITRELRRSWHAISGRKAELAVLADPAGYATMSGSQEDWLIPSGILGANISGLISRSILNKDVIGPGDFHGTIPVHHLADIDVSRDYVDSITAIAKTIRNEGSAAVTCDKILYQLREASAECVTRIAYDYSVTNLNRIKPGIAEATRAVLRRKPRKVFIRSMDDPDLAALIHLCRTDKIDLVVSAELTGPYRAITLIEKVT